MMHGYSSELFSEKRHTFLERKNDIFIGSTKHIVTPEGRCSSKFSCRMLQILLELHLSLELHVQLFN